MTAVANPITVTEGAANKITQLLDEEKKKEAGLRVYVQGGGCSGFQYGLMIEEGVGDVEVRQDLPVERCHDLRRPHQHSLPHRYRG